MTGVREKLLRHVHGWRKKKGSLNFIRLLRIVIIGGENDSKLSDEIQAIKKGNGLIAK